jgi:hypothetical protein
MTTKSRKASVTDLHTLRAADTIEILSGLLKHAQNGQLHGLLYVAKYRTREDVGATGEYRTHRNAAVGAAVGLVDALRERDSPPKI